MKGFSGGRRRRRSERKEEIFPPWPNLGNAYGICPRTKAHICIRLCRRFRANKNGGEGEEVLINAGLREKEECMRMAASIRGRKGANKISLKFRLS